MRDTEDESRTSHLAEVISSRVEQDEALADEAKLIVLAALDGDLALAEALEGEYTPPQRPTPADEEPAAKPAGAFVSAIRARGFRGIGPGGVLELHPAPGLTVVAGRNGSGKSSFSEALEMALTGNTYRWRKKNVAWKQNWRNLHDGEPCEIRIDLAEEGVGSTTIGVDWTSGAELAERKSWVQRSGRRREQGIAGLGWDRAAELYQPILSYDELGGLLEEGPSTLFDKLDGILGLEEAVDTERRLAEALKTLQEGEKAAKALQRDLKRELAALDDERATRALTELSKRPPDIATVESIAVGREVMPTGDLAQLQAMTRLRVPERHVVTSAAAALRQAEQVMADCAVEATETAALTTELLRGALAFHRHNGDGPCPVCGEGVLDAAWRERIERALADEDAGLQAFHEARHGLEQARNHAAAVLRQVTEPRAAGRFILQSLEAARAAWRRWSQAPEDAALAGHLESTYGDVASTFEQLSSEAEQVFAEHQDKWSPIARRLGEWVGLARAAQEKEALVGYVKSAGEFMKKTVADLRDSESAKLTDTAREVWAALKQESNVNLGRIEFVGAANRRRVKLYADVDGSEAAGGALGVMSQGELHALALALFLPRATMPGSPFRFIVLDDPIQAMDPAKIDGFVEVLLRLAEDRQVVVFSHDDRLPQVVRQMGVDARIVEVSRNANSTVRVEPCAEPAARYLEDARAVLNDPKVPDSVKQRVIPGIGRMAVEVACRDAFMTRRLSAGDKRAEVEDAWNWALSVRKRVALTVADDMDADPSQWLHAEPWRRRAHGLVTKGVHEGSASGIAGLLDDVDRTVADIRAEAR